MTEEQNLTKWKQDLKVHGKKIWPRFYESFLGTGVSSLPRLYRAVNLYGDDIVFDAIVDSSWRELTGDPINYVLKVASEKWKQQRAEMDSSDDYAKTIEEAKDISLQKNMALAKKMKKGKSK
jgi:hypothetical protein